MSYQILVLATYDSFLNSGVKLAERLSHTNIEINIIKTKGKQLSKRQLKDSNANKYKIYQKSRMSYSQYSKYDIVILALGNGETRRQILHFHQLFAEKVKRPLVISIFPGVIFGHADSILSRINSDILLVNSKKDEEIAQNLSKLYNPSLTIIPYGLINIEIDYPKREYSKKEENIYFIDQVKIPSTKHERVYVLQKLIEFAKANPQKKVWIKSRILPNERTVHKDLYAYSTLFQQIKDRPDNIEFTIEPIQSLYKKMDLCIGFSSTVLLEATYYQIPTAVITDLGCTENYHLPHFLDSQIMISLDQLINGKRPMISLQWKNQYINFDIDRDIKLNNTIAEIVKKKLLKNTNLFGGAQFNTTLKFRAFRKIRKLIKNPKLFLLDSIIFKKINLT